MKDFITPDEVTVIQMALTNFIEDLEAANTNVNFPFTPEARQNNREMITAAKSALSKIALASGKLIKLDPYNEGDEKEFLTKQS